jgi:eukaryotic-like serine/threonine-protein kinase
MNDQQWGQAWEIYGAAAEMDGAERLSFLASQSAESEVLDEVLSMLQEAQNTPGNEPALRTGSRFGRYEVGELLGSGGMGCVYAASDPELDRKAAIKFLSPELTDSDRGVERLIREAKAASSLNHPHIITVYEVIRAPRDVAIAMELVEGRALRKFCGAPVKIPQLIDWGRQIAQALAAAHQRHIIHRDVKPENLMVRDDGITKVLDFGLAAQFDGDDQKRPGDRSGFGGTLNYMSPEQIGGDRATAASDVFSLGVVLYELATGTHPFRSDSPIDTGSAIAHTEPKPPSSLHRAIPASIDSLLLRMLSKDPGKRPTATEVDRLLSISELGKPAGSNAISWLVAAVAVLAITSLLTYAFRGRAVSKAEPQFVQLTRQVNENRVTTAALSPDGKTLLFATFGGPVYRRRMDDGLSQPVDALKGLRVDRMVWFHDGSRVLINGSMAGARDKYQPDIWVMPADGGSLREVLSGGANGTPSPDGSRIAFTSADGSVLSLAPASGGEQRQIRSGGQGTTFTSLFWSTDGKRITFQHAEYVPPVNLESDPASGFAINRYQYSYESVDADSGNRIAFAKNFVMESACGLPDGRVLFLRNSTEQSYINHLWILRTDPHTGRLLDQPRQVTHEDYTLHELSASADGQEVIALRRGNGHPNIYVADLPPPRQYPRFRRVRRLTFRDTDEFPHAWTPDGRSVIFESNRNGNFDLFRQDIDQTDAQPLVVSNHTKVLAHVSPDGKWLLYNQQEKKSAWELMRIPLEGGPAAMLLPDVGLAGEYTCALHAAGRCVMRTVQGKEFIFWDLNPVRGKGRELARTAWTPAIMGDWDISPDGSEVAIPNHDPRNARIKVVPLDARGGTAERTVAIDGLKNLSGVAWAADGRGWYVAVVGKGRGLLFYVDLEGRILTNLMESMTPTFVVPSPDGRHVAFADWTASANVWSVRGL